MRPSRAEQELYRKLNEETARAKERNRINSKTRKRYDTTWKFWVEHSEKLNQDPRATPDDEAMRQFVASRLRLPTVKGKPAMSTTVRKDISKLAGAFRERGLRFPEVSRSTLPKTYSVLDGAKVTEAGKDKAPIGKRLMRMLFRKLPNTYESLVWECMFAMQLNTVRRISETLRPDLRTVEQIEKGLNGGIRREMLQFQDADGTVTSEPSKKTVECWFIFRNSKCNKGERLQSAHMTCRCGPEKEPFPCALHLIQRLIKVRSRAGKPFEAKSRMFEMPDGQVPSYEAANEKIKEMIESVGLKPRQYGTHSVRRGGVQDLEQEDVNEDYLDSQGGWCNRYGKNPYQSKEVKEHQRKKRALLSKQSKQK